MLRAVALWALKRREAAYAATSELLKTNPELQQYTKLGYMMLMDTLKDNRFAQMMPSDLFNPHLTKLYEAIGQKGWGPQMV